MKKRYEKGKIPGKKEIKIERKSVCTVLYMIAIAMMWKKVSIVTEYIIRC